MRPPYPLIARIGLSRIAGLLLLLVWSLPSFAQERAPRTDQSLNGGSSPAHGADRGSSANDSIPLVAMIEYTQASDRIELDYADLNQTGGTVVGTLNRAGAGTIGLNYCAPLSLHSGAFSLRLDLGPDYEYGRYPFSVDVNLSVEGIDNDNGGAVLLTHDPVILHIDSTAPEQVYHVTYSGSDLSDHDSIDEYVLTINNLFIVGDVDTALRVVAAYDDEYAIAPRRPIPNQNTSILEGDGALRWRADHPCADTFPSYQVQVLRLYNTKPEYVDNPEKLLATVDWDQSVTYEVPHRKGNTFQLLGMPIMQGVGWYVWRVRPIGSTQPNGSGDSRNWGVWTTAPTDGTVIDVGTPPGDPDILPSMFYYVDVDDSTSWAYSRSFTEGMEANRRAEGITYFTPMGRAVQSQVRVQETGEYLTAQTAYDFEGRAAVGTMASPTGDSTQNFQYRKDFFAYAPGVPFGAEHFDADSTYRNPKTASQTVGSVSKYFNGTVSQGSGYHATVPMSDGYPYARSLATPDGSGRAMEIGGTGNVHRIGGSGGGESRTTRVRYGSASDEELVRIFGDEAPADSIVQKVLVTGPNKVTAVQYVSEGRVIATALETAVGDDLLVDLDYADETRLQETVIDTLRSNRSSGRLGASSFKRYAFADTTPVTIRYRLTPNTIEANTACIDTCVYCDYRIRLYVHNVEHRDSTMVFEHLLGADPCGDTSLIVDTISLTLLPGTYVIERRLETGTLDTNTIDGEHPYGKTYAEQFRDYIATEMRDSIYRVDSIAVVRGFLDGAKLDSLYEYLGYDLDSLPFGSYHTIQTECCEVEIPIVDPDCGFNPCRDSVPDFEAYLFDEWGGTYGTNLDDYFVYDGDTPVYPSSGRPANPFNTLIANMLADTNASGDPLYDCGKLWSIWTGLVGGFELLSTPVGGGSGFNPDFNLLSSFLSAAGTHYVDTSWTPYSTTNGYLLHAHRYLNKNVLNNSDCNDYTDYLTSWHGDADSADRWRELYNCWLSQDRENSSIENPPQDCPNPDSCALAMRDRIENDCRTQCETRREEFAREIQRAYAGEGIDIPFIDALCKADYLVGECKESCELSIDAWSPLDSIGTQAEWENVRRVYGDRIQVSVPDTITGGIKVCSDTAATLSLGYQLYYEDLIVLWLNHRLPTMRAEAGNGFWNIKDELRPILHDSILSTITDSLVWVPSLSFGGTPYFELRDSCELWYVSDTVPWVGTHPMVSALNAYLNGLWGMEVDSSEAYSGSPFVMNAGAHEGRFYDAMSNVGARARELLTTEVHFVNGSFAYEPIGDYLFLDTVVNDEVGVLYAGDPFVRLAGSFLMADKVAGPDDELSFIAVIHQQDSPIGHGSFVDLLHSADLDIVGPTGFSNAWRAKGIDTGVGGFTTSSGYAYTESDYDALDERLDYPYTSWVGFFGQDSANYLVYYDHNWTPGSIADTYRIFGIRFVGAPTKKLSDDVCGVKSCPDICWRWVDVPLDTVADVSPPPTCVETGAARVRAGMERSITECIDEMLFGLEEQYEQQCATPDSLDETITIEYGVDLIHFSLNYFDRAGRLVRTVPPKGVNLLPSGATRGDHPAHAMISEYDYNALGQLVRAKTPDGGERKFWYDRYGRLRFSQDARLLALSKYAYTKYDSLGRVIQVGVSGDSIASAAFTKSANIDNLTFPTNGSERTYIAYDTSSALNSFDDIFITPQNLRGRVSKVWNDSGVYTHYTYDVHGNIEAVAQGIPGMHRPRQFVEYDYELVGGAINQVTYNRGRIDEFSHRFTYDRDNALRRVETSRDGVVWDNDALYDYYRHGPLRRVVLGEDSVQGLDYVYTLHGQLKAINHPTLDAARDAGRDGAVLFGSNTVVPADSFGLMMHYHPDDFESSGGGGHLLNSGGADDLARVPLYDGNIAGIELHVGKTTDTTAMGGKFEERTGESYRYDVLGRIDSSLFHTFDTGTASWNAPSPEYQTSYDYDPNGNFDTLRRHAYFDTAAGETLMDDLRYHYVSATSDKLDYVYDDPPVAGEVFDNDLKSGQSAGNYDYDANGNLKEDFSESGMVIDWDAYGRVRSETIFGIGGASTAIDYTYDAMGSRVKKIERHNPGGGLGTATTITTFYVRDAAGVVVAIYRTQCQDLAYVSAPPGPIDSDGDGRPNGSDNCPCVANPTQVDSDRDGTGNACEPSGGPGGDSDGDGVPSNHDNCPCTANITQADADGDGIGDACEPRSVCTNLGVEYPIYGRGRVGTLFATVPSLTAPKPDTIYSREIGEKRYELTDHLGNVRATLTDVKLSTVTGGVPDDFAAEITSYHHMYPFGMAQPGRTWEESAVPFYRYGYNGMETDPEHKGEWGDYTTYFRQYDPRLGRWMSQDPIVHAWESPYVAMFDNPIVYADPSGAEGGEGGDDNPLDPKPRVPDDYSPYDGPYEGLRDPGAGADWKWHEAAGWVIVRQHLQGWVTVYSYDRERQWWYNSYDGPSEDIALSEEEPQSLLGGIFSGVGEFVSDAKEWVVEEALPTVRSLPGKAWEFGSGFGSAVAEDWSWGLAPDPDVAPDEFWLGRKFGHGFMVIVGALEMAAGAAEVGVTVAGAPPTLGGSLALSPVGVGMIVHGEGTVVAAWHNLWNEEPTFAMSSDGGGGGGRSVPGTDKQWGKKFGEHRNLDRPGYRDIDEYKELANKLYNDPNSVITKFADDADLYKGETHYQLGNDLLRLDPQGNFRSLYSLEP